VNGTPAGTDRGVFAGVRMILRYNWPLYGAGLATVVAGTALAARATSPRLLRLGGAAAGLVAGWLSVASVLASWWVYDRSELYRWTWLPRAVPHVPRRVLVVHAGLDEVSGPVSRTWPTASVASVDVHGGLGRTTASLRIARRQAAGEQPSDGDVSTDNDLVVAFLAAHELRSRGRRVELIRDLAGTLVVGGRLVIVEHVRDLTNALAFGPAVGHFYPVAEWREVLRLGGLDVVTEERITPFVAVLTAGRSS
jgi:hypothetical protein